MADTTGDKIVYGVRKVRIKGLLATGAEDASATEYDIDKPQRVGKSYSYVDGEQAIQRGGDEIVAVINEDDKFMGVDLTLVLAALIPEVDETICGGVATPASGKWAAPTSIAEEAYPFEMTIWVANYTSSDANSPQDGFIKHTYPMCKGRRATDENADKTFGTPSYTIEARRNDSDSENIGAAVTYEKVDAIE